MKAYRQIIIALLVTAGVILLYSPGISHVWVFDDTANLVEPWHDLGETHFLERLRTFTFGNQSGPLGRPISMFTFALNGLAVGGLDPIHLKATNLFIHLIVGLLVFLLAREICSRARQGNGQQVNVSLAASFAAALWVLNPLHVSTVLYSVQRMTQLSALFTLAGLWIYCRSRVRWTKRPPRASEVFSLAAWILLLTLLATLSKENGVILLWLVLLTELFVFRAVICGVTSSRLLALLWVMFIAPVVFAALWVLSDPAWLAAAYATRDFTLAQRVMTQLGVLWQYLSWFLLPDIRGLGFYHDDIVIADSLMSPMKTAVAGVGWLSVLAFAFVMRCRLPLLAYCLLFFLIGHSLESTILPLMMVFEHRNYLPLVGISIFAGYTLAVLFQQLRGGMGYVLITVIVCFLAMQLSLRANAWGDSLLLAKTMAENHPDSRLSRNLYANTLLQSREEISADSDSSRQLRAHYLRLARDEYLAIASRFARDPGAPAMLYVLDSQYLSGRTNVDAWLDTSLGRLKSKTLDPIDLGAIRAILGCHAVAVCDISDDRFAQLTELASRGFNEKPAGYFAIHDYYLRSSAPAEQRIQWLLTMPSHMQSGYQFRRRLILEYLGDGQRFRALGSVPGLFTADPARRHLERSALIIGMGLGR
ncbi:MAG: hypothetical protein RIC89_12510 [Pseudomonadales bacterium]